MNAALTVLYKNNYGDSLSESTQRNLRILQFLVQLNSWVLNRIPELEELTPHASSSMRDQQRRDMLVNQSCRRIWLKANKESRVLDYAKASDSWRLRNPQLCLADHLIPLFMWVSIDLFKVSKSPELSLQWMKLAIRLMVQAAIEILDAPDLLASGSDVAQNALQECFAWGDLGNSHSTCSSEAIANEIRARGFPSTDTTTFHGIARLEDRCQDMFRGHTIGREELSAQGSLSGSQKSIWENTKHKALEDVLMTFTSIQEAGTDLSHRPIELLRKEHQLTFLLKHISEFIEIHWRLLHSTKWHKKPVLIQIEEGGIDGLTPGEFEEFKRRARIQDMWTSTLLDEDSSSDSALMENDTIS